MAKISSPAVSEVGAAAASRGPDGGLSGSAEDAGDGVAGDGGGEGLSSGMMKNDPGAGSWTRRPVTTATRRFLETENVKMGRVDLLIQNWFHRKSKGRQCKGRWPRNFDFFS